MNNDERILLEEKKGNIEVLLENSEFLSDEELDKYIKRLEEIKKMLGDK